MRNLTAGIVFCVLLLCVIIAWILHVRYGDMGELGMFVVTAMTALGTCGVIILSLFPYVPRDKLEATLCIRKKKMCIMIRNKGNHTVYLGSDKYHTAETWDCYALWWSNKDNCTAKNSKPIFAAPGDNMAVPPRGTIGFPIGKNIFGKIDLNKIKIQVLTSSGFRIDVKNEVPDNAVVAK